MMLGTLGYVLYRFLFVFLKVSPPGSFPPPLTRTEEEALFRQMKAGDSSARETLICHNLRLVAHIVKRYYANCQDQDDLISIGTVGLIKAIDTYDIDKGARFATYAGKCLQNEILMHFRAQKKSSSEVSLNESIDTDKDGNPMTYMDVIQVDDTIADEIDLKIRTDAALQTAERVLDRREKQILVLRFGLDGKAPVTQREAAKRLGISRSYVSRIEKAALEKLRLALGG